MLQRFPASKESLLEAYEAAPGTQPLYSLFAPHFAAGEQLFFGLFQSLLSSSGMNYHCRGGSLQDLAIEDNFLRWPELH